MIRRQVRRTVINHIIIGTVFCLYALLLTAQFWLIAVMGSRKTVSSPDIPWWTWLVVAPALFFFGRAFFFLLFPSHHPVMRRLAIFGPPDQIADEIDRDLENQHETLVIGRRLPRYDLSKAMGSTVLLSRNWLLQPTQFGLKVVRLDDILGVQKFVFAPRLEDQDRDFADLSAPGFSNGVEIRVRQGKDQRFVLPSDDVRHLVVSLIRRVPWVYSGFDQGWEEQWRGDRRVISEHIQAERQGIQGLSPEAIQSLVADKIKQAEEKIRIIRDGETRRE